MSDIAEYSEIRGFDSYPVRLGDVMRGERATLGKSLLDVQRDLRIKAAYIAAIENTDPSAFQTPGFIAGYVRSYARYLGLSPEHTFRQFCVESGFDGVHPEVERKTKPAPVTPIARPTGRVAKTLKNDPIMLARTPFVPAGDGFAGQVSMSALGSVAVLLVLILGLGYGAWAVLQDIQRVEFTPVQASDDVIATAPDIAPAPAALMASDDSAALEQLYRPRELDVPVMTPRDGPIAALNPDEIGALVTNNATLRARETAELLHSQPPQVTEPAAPTVSVVAMRPAWVRVSLTDGTVLFEKILDGGESFRLPADSEATRLRAGNSGAVFLTIDGTPYGPVGKDSSVVKNVALAPADILSTFTAVVDTAALRALDSPRVITLNQTSD